MELSNYVVTSEGLQLEVEDKLLSAKRAAVIKYSNIGKVVVAISEEKYYLGVIVDVELYDKDLPYLIRLVSRYHAKNHYGIWRGTSNLHIVNCELEQIQELLPEYFL